MKDTPTYVKSNLNCETKIFLCIFGMIENTPENDALRDFSVSSRKHFARAALDPGILRFPIIFIVKNVKGTLLCAFSIQRLRIKTKTS